MVVLQRYIGKLMVILIIIFEPVFAKEKLPVLKIAVEEYPNHANKDGSGVYLDVTNKVLKNHYKIAYVFGPWARLERLLKKEKLDGFLVHNPFVSEKYFGKKFVFPKVHLNESVVYAIYNKDKYSKWKDERLQSARLLWINGYKFNKIYELGSNFKVVDKNSSGLRLLLKDRADVFLTYWLTTSKIRNGHYSKDKVD